MSLFQTLDFLGLYQQTVSTLTVVFSWFPYWGPILLGYMFWHQWMHYVQGRHMAKINWILLEIKLPKETYKSPLAMEIVLNALYQAATGTWFDKIWRGKVKDWSSLEMVSIEGHIKFFIRTPWIYKNVIEAQLYSQYPDVEIYEVPDYVRYVDYRGKEGDWSLIGAEYGLSKPDPYPIKTYVDYGLDKDPKEEFKIDPLTSIIEYLGSFGRGHQFWLQIIIRAHKGTKKDATGKEYDPEWKHDAEKQIEDILKKAKGEKGEDG